MKNRTGNIIAAVVTALALVGLTVGIEACGGNDASVGHRDTGSADVMNYPNHFSNVAQKCDGHGHRVYVVDHGDSSNGRSAVAVADDPSCR